MDLQAYLDRIGHQGEVAPDVKTLAAIHRGHVLNVPFENIDVLLGRTADFDIERIFDKLVTRRRGGWCYEMNGLFAWALETIGFEVTRMAGGVGRSVAGDDKVGNHLVLLVEGHLVADVGFGDGLYEPVPLEVGSYDQRGFESTLETPEEDWWRYRNAEGQDFDFKVEPASLALLQEKCDYLRDSPESGFTQNLVVELQRPDRAEILRNSIRTTIYPNRRDQRALTDPEEFVTELRTVFGLEDPEIESLWPQARARGEAFLESLEA